MNRFAALLMIIPLALSSCSLFSPRSRLAAPEGLAGRWSFDSGDARDTSGRGHHGRMMGCAPVEGITGRRKSALRLDGRYDFILVPHNDDFNFGKGPFAVSCWIKTTAQTGGTIFRDDLVTKGDASLRGFSLSLENNRMAFFFGWNQSWFGTTPVNDGQWHHLFAQRDAEGQVTLCLDGRVEPVRLPVGGGDPSGKDDVSTADPLILGRHGAKNESFYTGDLDEVRLYNRVLSPAEVKSLYAARGKKSSEPVKPGVEKQKPKNAPPGKTGKGTRAA